jgi:DNA polymerase I
VKKKLFLVDTSSLIFRAFYAIRPLTAPDGTPVNAVYGFLSMVTKLLLEHKPDYISFCKDRPEPSFRKALDINYKANRSEMPTDLIPQMPYIEKIAEILGIHCIDQLGFEADDLIGTLAVWGAQQDLQVSIVSGDKDFAQLVNANITMLDTMKDEVIDARFAFTKWGVRPDQMIDYLSLVGDSSDNIPGVKGIGPKGAVKLLADFESLDGVYKNIDAIKGKTQEHLVRDKEQAYLSQKLVTIVTTVPLSQNLSDYELKTTPVAKAEELLLKLNFKSSLTRLKELPHLGAGLSTPEGASSVASLENTTQYAWIEQAGDVANFRETTKHSANELWIFSLPTGFYLADEASLLIFRLEGELADWSSYFSETKIQLKGFALKQQAHALNLDQLSVAWDSQLAAYVLRPGENFETQDGLASWLGRGLSDPLQIKELVSEHLMIAEKLKQELVTANALDIAIKLEFPTTEVLFAMEKQGCRIDLQQLKTQSLSLETDLAAIQSRAFALIGKEINLSSPKQLSVVLFDQLKLPPSKKTKTGFSTDNDVLEKLKGLHPLIEEILAHRELSKLKSTYVDALPLLVKADGRVHTTFHQALTSTGRLSSTDPNLQNIPIRTPRGNEVRKAFIPEPGLTLLSADYSQIELRVLAHYADDAGLIQAFKDDLDIHQATAAEVFAVKLDQVTAEQRRAAKAVNFGIAYGQGAFGLAENLGISRSEAQEIINNYFKKFKGVSDYIHQMTELAQSQGYVETLLGRRRYIKELKASNPMVRKAGERAAINAPIQGTAADIVKQAMIDLRSKLGSKLILQVHDELLFEGTPAQIEKDLPVVRQLMESAFTLKVPLKVNCSVGLSWADAH